MKQTVPKPAIYLRNNFTMMKNRENDFLVGKENLLRNTSDTWTLIAAGGQRSFLGETRLPEPPAPMMQIWKLENWDTLYNSIYAFAETEWYRRLGASLSGECQELLVGVLADNGECNRPAWKSDSEPGYSYLYEEVMPNPGDTHSYLRDLNWLSAQVASAEFGWKRAWTATHVTSRPSLISVLWRVPSVGSIDTTLARISSEKPYAQRYAQMMGNLRELTRQSFHPIYTERLDERIRAGEKSPLIKR